MERQEVEDKETRRQGGTRWSSCSVVPGNAYRRVILGQLCRMYQDRWSFLGLCIRVRFDRLKWSDPADISLW